MQPNISTLKTSSTYLARRSLLQMNLAISNKSNLLIYLRTELQERNRQYGDTEGETL